ncbi:MAG: cellulase family glycosylhydrolase [Oscillospiraceae bacterium]|nr:cellulase family glycosylhydrolase [Oscillospiraceae bacterium]
MKKLIAVFLVIMLVLSVSGCGKNPDDTAAGIIKRETPLKYGINAHIFELRPVMDPSSVLANVSDMSGVFGFEYYRLSTPLDSMFTVGEGDVPIFKEGQRKLIHQVIEKMTAAGVKKFVAVSDAPIYPYGYKVTTTGVIPDPVVERDMYIRWMKLYARAWAMIVEEFPEIAYVETVNEPDLGDANIFTKQGHQWGVDDQYKYSTSDKAHMIADLQYYTYKAVKEVNPKVSVTTPGFSTRREGEGFLDVLYEAIESGAHPFGEDFGDTNPDNYFDAINFHCYLNTDTIDEYFKHCDDFYKATERHNDVGKPAILTECGFTDHDNEANEITNGEKMTELLNLYNEKMPYLEAVMFYMLNDYHTYSVNTSEDNFGLFTSFGDPEKPCCPKPATIVLYKFMHKTEDITPLYKYCPELIRK